MPCFFFPFASPTVSLEDDGDVVLDEGADVEQHSRRVNSAETELDVVCRVVVAQAEIVIMRVDPVRPRRLVRYGFLSYVVPQPRSDLKVSSDVLGGKIIVELDKWRQLPIQKTALNVNSPLWQ